MLQPDDKKQMQIKKVLTGIMGILFLFYVVSCSDSTPSPSTDATPPSAVSNLRVVSSTHDQVVLSWVAPTNAGTTDGTTAATISSYVVKYKTGDNDFTEIDETGEGVRLSGALTGTSTNATVTGLNENTRYTFSVVAVNSANEIGDDSIVEGTTKKTTPPPENLRQVNTCAKATSVDLTWDASAEATSYKLYRDDTEITNITGTSYTDTGLTAGTQYTYTVEVCTDAGCSAKSQPLTITTLSDKSLKHIIDSGKIPTDLNSYDERSQEIFSSRYSQRATLVAIYLKPGGTGDGSSFEQAKGDPKAVLDGITDASATNVYVVFLAGGTYTPETMKMKNHVAIIGGVDECLDSSDTITALDGEGSRRLFYNPSQFPFMNDTALLYGVTITNGNADEGGGMYNDNSSPRLVGVTFSGNSANSDGGGMYNNNSSSPSLVGVTFSGNRANSDGGGMYNFDSSPSLVGVTFSGNQASQWGGGMANQSSSPSLSNVTFSENTATRGGGMYNNNSSPSLAGVTFSGNRANDSGGGMYNYNNSSPSLVGVTFSGNSANNGAGGGMFNQNSSPIVINGIFWGNTAASHSEFFPLQPYNSIVQGGATGTAIITNDPGLGKLADNGGAVWTHAIESNSPAVNQGLYVRMKEDKVNNTRTLYYSVNNTDWYTSPDLSGEKVTVPAGAEDLTATDATGYKRTGRPDLGAYEAR